MSVSARLNIGLVGAAGRGGSFRAAFEANGARVHAVCDIRAEELERCRRELGASEAYADYAEMIEKSDLDAVVVGTPMPFHVPQSILALQHGLHVLSEVPAGVSVDECKALVRACRTSKGLYMMAENYTYLKTNVLIREIVRQGLFGVVYYAEGEYLHELKELNEITRWRRQWQTGVDGITYGTHSLGPILQWMPGDRVVRVSCEGSGHHYRDPRGDPYHDDTAVMLCKTAKGVLIKIRLDMLSDRPHCLTNYQLQGTDGCYESSRGGPVDRGKIWFRQLSREIRWHDADALMEVEALAEKYLPDLWRHPPPEALRSGHWGGDYFEVLDFVNSIRGKAPCPIGIHEAMDMTLPGLISQESIARGGAWLDVPDSRVWSDTPPYRQLHMLWPESKLGSPPVPHVPHGYEMRQYRESDEAEYLALMAKVGFKTWDHEQMGRTLRSVLPGGFFVIVHRATGKIVATAMAQHKPTDLHPFGGEMGWVAADPDHKAQGLGRAATAAATTRLAQAGYRDIYLQTDDFRLPALAIYLRLGFEPLLYAEGMAERWQAVRNNLRRPSLP